MNKLTAEWKVPHVRYPSGSVTTFSVDEAGCLGVLINQEWHLLSSDRSLEIAKYILSIQEPAQQPRHVEKSPFVLRAQFDSLVNAVDEHRLAILTLSDRISKLEHNS